MEPASANAARNAPVLLVPLEDVAVATGLCELDLVRSVLGVEGQLHGPGLGPALFGLPLLPPCDGTLHRANDLR